MEGNNKYYDPNRYNRTQAGMPPQGQGYPQPQPQPPKGKGFGIASMVCGIVALVLTLLSFCFALLLIPAAILGLISIVMGIIAVAKNRGKGMAVSGLVCTGVGLFISLFVIVVWIFMVSVFGLAIGMPLLEVLDYMDDYEDTMEEIFEDAGYEFDYDMFEYLDENDWGDF